MITLIKNDGRFSSMTGVTGGKPDSMRNSLWGGRQVVCSTEAELRRERVHPVPAGVYVMIE